MFFRNGCPKAEISRAWSGCRYDRGKTRRLGTGRGVPICLSPLRFVVFPIFRPSFRLCPPVPDRQRRSGTGGLRLFFRGRNFFFSYSFCLLPPIDQKPFRAGQAHFCGSLHIQETRLPRRGGGRDIAFLFRRIKLKNLTFFSEYYEKFTFFTI